MLEQTEDENIRFIFSELGGDIDRKQNILLRSTTSNRDNRTAILVQITDVTGAGNHVDSSMEDQTSNVNPNAAGPTRRSLDSITEIHSSSPTPQTDKTTSEISNPLSTLHPKWMKNLVWLLVLIAIFFIAFFYVRSTLS